VELAPLPIRRAVDPEILEEPAVRLLGDREVDERTQRRAGIAARDQRARRLHHVARPHEVVAAEVFVSHGIAPGDARRGDEGALERLVLMGEQEVVARAVEPPAIPGDAGEVGELRARLAPLRDEARTPQRERLAQRLRERRGGGVEAIAERETERELRALVGFDAADHGDVAVAHLPEAPVEAEIVLEVAPAVGEADIAARGLEEPRAHAEREMSAALPCDKDALARGFGMTRGIARASAAEVRRE